MTVGSLRVLVLAGTSEGRELITALAGIGGIEATASLAGRTSTPAEYPCPVRTGGFGGVDGLVDHLRSERIDALVDATHPFAATMSAHAVLAARRAGVPHLRIERPPWAPVPGDRWIHVDEMAGAAAAVQTSGAARVLLTVGRLELEAFAGIDDVSFVVRTIEAPAELATTSVVHLADRGPFDVADEVALLDSHDIDLVVTKNAGGDDAKLVAARRLGTPVVMVRRPARVPGSWVRSVGEAVEWVDQLRGRR